VSTQLTTQFQVNVLGDFLSELKLLTCQFVQRLGVIFSFNHSHCEIAWYFVCLSYWLLHAGPLIGDKLHETHCFNVHVHHHFTLGDLVSAGSHCSQLVICPSPHHNCCAGHRSDVLLPFLQYHW